MHNRCLSAPGNKIYHDKKRIRAFNVHVYYILHGFDILDFVRCIFTFISDNVIQQYNSGFQRRDIIYDYQSTKEKINLKKHGI